MCLFISAFHACIEFSVKIVHTVSAMCSAVTLSNLKIFTISLLESTRNFQESTDNIFHHALIASLYYGTLGIRKYTFVKVTKYKTASILGITLTKFNQFS